MSVWRGFGVRIVANLLDRTWKIAYKLRLHGMYGGMQLLGTQRPK